ncbi:RusA family crossover junction endodeoxyribonuclease [Polycladomyces subterraneus]|uniref:RusA family crossover junction endodeoxyribonuclease n=1 Tax=Polycladomyces subterraneus TaxID=1016997 RepID=A0ABT8IKB1_9BACL|nr:RusA family crossover junction endodeoxyribonuclease [Polycladomyces subterraneus]MDN4593194.1 RusA family crossover junction endodeoxyribonuclease [Polycladomyces subterraneus]
MNDPIRSSGPVCSGPTDDISREAITPGTVPRYDGPVAVKMVIYLWKHGKEGDIDNMQKTILDALNGIAWTDDRQVMEVFARKHYVNSPNDECVLVSVTNYTPEKEVVDSA